MEFFTPPQHIGFKATKLYEQSGNIKDISLAYVDKDGGGPVRAHTHAHDHLFTVIEGEAKIVLKDESVIVKKAKVCWSRAIFLTLYGTIKTAYVLCWVLH